MIKRLLLFLILLGSVCVSTVALAQESTKSAGTAEKTATSSAIDEEKVKSLKDKLATRVAELRENQTRGFYGEIAALSKTSFTLVMPTGEVKVRFSTDTLIYKLTTTKAVAAIKDLKNTLSATVLGMYDDSTKQLSANIILLQTLPSFYVGQITKIDKDKAVVTIKPAKGNEISLDYETTTKASEVDKLDKKVKRSGLSRLVVGDTLQAWGLMADDDAQKIKATKILRIPKDLFEEIAPTASPPAASPSATPKTSPKATPKATPKASPKASP